MYHLSTVFLTLATAAKALKTPSFAPPDFPVSNIDNDGTHAGRYDVRKTMVWLDDKNPENLNSYFFLFWLRTVGGLQTLNSTGATVFAPGTGSTDHLNLQSEIQNLTSPKGSDNYTDLYIKSDYAGVKPALSTSQVKTSQRSGLS